MILRPRCFCSQAWARMPTERDRMKSPRPSSGSKPSSQKITAVMPSMFIGMVLPLWAFSAASTARPMRA